MEERKLFYVSTAKEWKYKEIYKAFRHVLSYELPTVKTAVDERTGTITYHVWAYLTSSQESALKHILDGIGRPWIYKDGEQRIVGL